MHLLRITALAALSVLGACTLHIDRDTRIEGTSHHSSLYQVDGSINLAPGSNAGNLTGVSTNITLQHGAQAGRLRTVDGAIKLESRATARGDVMSVDGAIHLATDARVLGNVQTLTSTITLDNAVIGGGLETVSGTIRIGGSTLVNQGITLKKPTSRETGSDVERLPTLIIGPKARVMGPVIAERGANVWISRAAQVGRLEGATVHWFEGDTPPAS